MVDAPVASVDEFLPVPFKYSVLVPLTPPPCNLYVIADVVAGESKKQPLDAHKR